MVVRGLPYWKGKNSWLPSLFCFFSGVFVNFFFIAYLLSPRFCHRFVGYLEEEAVKTYTYCLKVTTNLIHEGLQLVVMYGTKNNYKQLEKESLCLRSFTCNSNIQYLYHFDLLIFYVYIFNKLTKWPVPIWLDGSDCLASSALHRYPSGHGLKSLSLLLGFFPYVAHTTAIVFHFLNPSFIGQIYINDFSYLSLAIGQENYKL